MVDCKISEMDAIETPNRKNKTCVCHINMLKGYVGREICTSPSPVVPPVDSVSVAQPWDDRRSSVSCARLRHNEILSNTDAYLVHLSDSARCDISELIKDYPDFFSDIFHSNHCVSHDIDVGNHKPIKQHPSDKTCLNSAGGKVPPRPCRS